METIVDSSQLVPPGLPFWIPTPSGSGLQIWERGSVCFHGPVPSPARPELELPLVQTVDHTTGETSRLMDHQIFKDVYRLLWNL